MSEGAAYRLLSFGMKVFWSSVLEQIDESDEPRLFVSLDVVINGKEHSGCILTLDDRAVIAWIVGMVQQDRFVEVVPYSTVKKVVADTKPRRGMRSATQRLTISAEKDWTLLFTNAGTVVPKLVHGALTETVTFK
jgi:hypothetical protein